MFNMIRYLALFLIIINQNQCYDDKTPFLEAKGIIIESASVKKIVQDEKVVPLVSSMIIPFSLNTVAEKIIKRDYIDDYSFSKKFTLKERKIINRVLDSLSIVEKELNKNYVMQNRILEVMSDSTEHNIIIFFSEILNNTLYAEVLSCKDLKLNCDQSENIKQGEAVTFLFNLNDKGEIIDYLKGNYIYE